MTALACPRCGTHLVAEVVHVQDGPHGIHAVTEAPVAAHVIACPGGDGFEVTVTSATQRPTARLTTNTEGVA